MKKIGCLSNNGAFKIDELENVTNFEASEKIANFFAHVSNQYDPVDLCQLPSYLPSPKPPQVSEAEVYKTLKKLKNTKSCHPLDLPSKLRREYDIFLVAPLTDIINTCLNEQIFPDIWKIEYVSPLAKVNSPTEFKQLRKIVSTSDYSKLYENILKEFILRDAERNFDSRQFGARKGVGTEFLVITFVDRVLRLLESTKGKSAVLAAAADWVSAFDKIDPTSLSLKLIQVGIRPAIIPILISYISNRKIKVKFNNSVSSEKDLIGGTPQGTILSGIVYNISSIDCAVEEVTTEDRFWHFDDLNTIELIILNDLLAQYEVFDHVPSDVATDELYLKPETYKTQGYLDAISKWTVENKMLLNEQKSNFIIFSRCKDKFTTRLKLNNIPISKLSTVRILGVWLQEDLGWEENTKQICVKAYSRISILSKLKYAGIEIEDLITIYILFIRSLTEYCSVVFNTSLTQKQSKKIETIQSTSLKIILDVNYVSYNSALEMTGLDKLSTRRDKRQLNFAKKCTKNEFTSYMFPKNPP